MTHGMTATPNMLAARAELNALCKKMNAVENDPDYQFDVETKTAPELALETKTAPELALVPATEPEPETSTTTVSVQLSPMAMLLPHHQVFLKEDVPRLAECDQLPPLDFMLTLVGCHSKIPVEAPDVVHEVMFLSLKPYIEFSKTNCGVRTFRALGSEGYVGYRAQRAKTELRKIYRLHKDGECDRFMEELLGHING